MVSTALSAVSQWIALHFSASHRVIEKLLLRKIAF
jgi:hypothetical protein